ASPGSLAPPTGDVRREMLRLEIEAQLTNAQAEVGALAADAAVEEGRSLDPLTADSDADLAGRDELADNADVDVPSVVGSDAEPVSAEAVAPATSADDEGAPPA
ncbi:MAG: hypothetical protein QOF49_1960, partial [Chloroflexota bacterium]|nr:hypothetical protein [Chloroflexota bacterium]